MAIKVIKRRSSLENELNAHRLSHENVTKIKDVIDEANDDEDKCAIVVLEYVGQFNLKALLEQKSSELTSKVVKRYAIILTVTNSAKSSMLCSYFLFRPQFGGN